MTPGVLTSADFAALIANGTVFERAAGQPTAVLHADGSRFIKIWERKQGLSSDLFSPYALRFCRNCARLAERQVAAPRVRALYTVIPGRRHVVIYDYQPGKTAQQLAEGGALPVTELAEFYAELHAKGIYFRSLHLGNILRLESGQFALLDVTDVKFYRRPLSRGERQRNLAYAWTRQRLRHLLPPPILEALLAAYGTAAGLGGNSDDERFVVRLRRDLGLAPAAGGGSGTP